MDRRLQLQTVLEDILEGNKVYYQPPENITLTYPCVVYNLDDIWIDRANNALYRGIREYQLKLIDRKVESVYFDPILKLSMCVFDRAYTANNLNHFVFNLYF